MRKYKAKNKENHAMLIFFGPPQECPVVAGSHKLMFPDTTSILCSTIIKYSVKNVSMFFCLFKTVYSNFDCES